MSGKSKVKKSKFKKQRQLGIELPGLGKPGALAKRAYPPGQHGQGRKRVSDYGTRLKEKQKVLFHYNIREKQFCRFVKKAKTGHVVNWVDQLFLLLESRLDNVVFRLGFAPSLPAARQMVVHGHVLVDGKRLDRPSAIMKIGQEISLVDKFYGLTIYEATKQNPTLALPDFLEIRTDKKKEIGKMIHEPGLQYVPFELESRFIAEKYAHVNP